MSRELELRFKPPPLSRPGDLSQSFKLCQSSPSLSVCSDLSGFGHLLSHCLTDQTFKALDPSS